MVYQDLSAQPTDSVRIAPLSDRFLSIIFDVVLFGPLFSLILSTLFRKLELMFFVSPDSVEFLVLCGVAVVFVSLLTILFQTLFLFLMGATPGKYFFKIQVVSIQKNQSQLRFSQAFLRSFLWVVEFFFLLVPFLEVLSDPLRRPLHDRAAGTLTVTLKKEGDLGPHLMETQFVRQLLVFTSLCALTWVIFLTGHFYKMAVRGEFKKTELEAAEYLCSSVTNSVKSNELRIDKALALFLADEISENCLASEADFVLWGHQDDEKAWAYLAKGILKKYDSEEFAAYLEKACETDESGAACQIARHEAAPRKHPLPASTETSEILQVTQDFEKGRYAETEKQFIKLSRKLGYETFAQSGLVKSLWAQNKIERARGAYQAVANQLARNQQLELSAWVCHEEMDQSCSSEAAEACENLKETVVQARKPIQETFVALALIREKECRQTNVVFLAQFEKLFAEKKDVLSYIQVISRNSKMEESQKLKTLEELAFRKETVRPLFLRRLAIQQWAEMTRDEKDLVKIVQFLKEKKIRDISWVKVYRKTLESFLKLGSNKNLKELVELPSEELIQTYQLQNMQVQGHYLARNYEKAWRSLKGLQSSNRVPASIGQFDVKQIQKDLETRFAPREATR